MAVLKDVVCGDFAVVLPGGAPEILSHRARRCGALG